MGLTATTQQIAPEVSGGLLSGINPVLAFGSILLALAMVIAWSGKYLTGRDGYLERRQTAQHEHDKAVRDHEQALATQRATDEQRIVDQVLSQTTEQTKQLIAQSQELQSALFTVLTGKLEAIGNDLGQVRSSMSSMEANTDNTTQLVRGIHVEMVRSTANNATTVPVKREFKSRESVKSESIVPPMPMPDTKIAGPDGSS